MFKLSILYLFLDFEIKTTDMAEIILISSSDSDPENELNHELFTERDHEKRVFEGFTFTFEKKQSLWA